MVQDFEDALRPGRRLARAVDQPGNLLDGRGEHEHVGVEGHDLADRHLPWRTIWPPKNRMRIVPRVMSRVVVGMTLDHSWMTFRRDSKYFRLLSSKRPISYASRAKARTTCTPVTFSCRRVDRSPRVRSTL